MASRMKCPNCKHPVDCPELGDKPFPCGQCGKKLRRRTRTVAPPTAIPEANREQVQEQDPEQEADWMDWEGLHDEVATAEVVAMNSSDAGTETDRYIRVPLMDRDDYRRRSVVFEHPIARFLYATFQALFANAITGFAFLIVLVVVVIGVPLAILFQQWQDDAGITEGDELRVAQTAQNIGKVAGVFTEGANARDALSDVRDNNREVEEIKSNARKQNRSQSAAPADSSPKSSSVPEQPFRDAIRKRGNTYNATLYQHSGVQLDYWTIWIQDSEVTETLGQVSYEHLNEEPLPETLSRKPLHDILPNQFMTDRIAQKVQEGFSVPARSFFRQYQLEVVALDEQPLDPKVVFDILAKSLGRELSMKGVGYFDTVIVTPNHEVLARFQIISDDKRHTETFIDQFPDTGFQTFRLGDEMTYP